MAETMVRIGEFATTAHPDEPLVAVGLGSCVGVAVVDRRARVTGLAHVMLPASEGHRAPEDARFADHAIPALLAAMESHGARRERLEAWLAGGASMFHGGAGLDIGPRNADAVQEALAAARVPVRGAELGGSAGRTLRADARGRITVKRAGGQELVMAHGANEKAR